ncbi:hypothetical protein HDZ31DRAFT_46699 [Schizophyllum fasciatum]
MRLIIGLFQYASDNVEDHRIETTSLLLAQPNSLVLLLDVWFRLPQFLLEIQGNHALFPLSKAVAEIYCELDNLELKAIVERELHRGAHGNGRRLYRHIARLISILMTLRDDEDEGGILAMLGLASCLLPDGQTHDLRPSVMPRDMINASVAIVRRHAGQPYEIMVQSACFFLNLAWTGAADLRPLLWSLQEGVLPNILRMRQTKLRKGDPTLLLRNIEKALAHRRVLRTFWHAYQRDKQAIEQASWHPMILDDILRRAQQNWVILQELQDTWSSMSSHCYNTDCPTPALQLYQCPCKFAYYCSKECQKKAWRSNHRRACHASMWAYIEETKGGFPYPLYSKRDIEYLTRISKAYMDDHLDSVYDESRKIEPSLQKTFWLTVSWAGRKPSHWVELAPYFVKPRMVVMRAALMMGNELTVVTLPSASLTVREGLDDKDEEGGKELGADAGSDGETQESPRIDAAEEGAPALSSFAGAERV